MERHFSCSREVVLICIFGVSLSVFPLFNRGVPPSSAGVFPFSSGVFSSSIWRRFPAPVTVSWDMCFSKSPMSIAGLCVLSSFQKYTLRPCGRDLRVPPGTRSEL